MATPPAPPRLTGVPETDIVIIAGWMSDFYRSVVLEGLYIEGASQVEAGTFDPSSLPDPASSTIAIAQNTVNQAYALAVANKAIADANAVSIVEMGSVTISNTDTTGDFMFTTAEPDTSHFVAATLQAQSSTPAAGSESIVGMSKAVGAVTLDVGIAPGAGESVTFDVLVMRNI